MAPPPASEWVLIYQVVDDELRLVRTGCHSDLFRE
ncbi:MAG: type II toxin-antitoxin system YafQ family toxin [Pseudomonadales bacterium]|nr:type II toxin-antitoxin system YafQ family toxin [Pseudomonadales bacterium]